ncbi:MAG: hypothetical protein IM628_12730 [Phenylobacterium sp.]|uniref:head-tail joining protein n=1 Tax=Phenylobacterium sp. TaxID=1871053 RepID=UPI0025F68583|nr:hypothetical protein [Phenylobacterium sp.]MCA6305663.1 hypothetical protein [Phenylobacterium sp.]
MTSPFAPMIDILFADPAMAVDATHVPQGGGAGTAVRAILARPDAVFPGVDAGVRSPSLVAEVRVAELPAPSEGDTLAVGATQWRIDALSRPDPERLLWRLELVE